MNNNIKWLFSRAPTSEDSISIVESYLHVKFPDDFIDCIKNNHGGNPSMQIYSFEGYHEAVFNSLLNFNPDENNYILDVYNDIKDRLVRYVYPFADDPFGNYICFDYRKTKNNIPTIVFWDHEIADTNPEEAILPVCETFNELISRLKAE
ncbi:MAG: SMI1/KNR4 family protein [Defluviitaleaceae bacterium]|nr:SMI1/KNR4 family protein [Defluviitaleaceae bacterium]MCL2261742.1 SMI1/KNR4 family protein [Defluviitaleaceae bacterium]